MSHEIQSLRTRHEQTKLEKDELASKASSLENNLLSMQLEMGKKVN